MTLPAIRWLLPLLRLQETYEHKPEAPAKDVLRWRFRLVSFFDAGVILAIVACAASTTQAGDKPAGDLVSYYQQIRPILQANCQGCHQPAKARGDYVMTMFDRLVAGGESGEKAIVPFQPAKSHLLEQITPVNGQAKMPEGRKPLEASEIELIRRWIAQGAKDDTPASASRVFDLSHPPAYTRPPVITSLDFAPDGKLLAVAGFHEVMLVEPETGKLTGRLIGLSERVQSVRFSPDGRWLAVAGGLPARMGEIQVWDVAKRQLKLSKAVAFDTVYGVSWSPDGARIAFGWPDNTVRAIDAQSGQQILYQGSHTDWILDTVFSADGSHLASVGRDMTAKLTEVATQRFIDNISSITPGALKGGILTVARHPSRDEIVIGGSDGVPKVYRMHRLTKRAIGDDANMIRELPAMKGRIFSVAVSRDGKRIAAGSSLDGTGEVNIYGYEFDTGLPGPIKEINEKVATTRTPEEKAALDKYHHQGVQTVAKTAIPQSAVYTVAFHPSGKLVAAAGSDGTIRLLDADKGTIVRQFSPAPLSEPKTVLAANRLKHGEETLEPEKLAIKAPIVGLEVQPMAMHFSQRFDYTQLCVTGKLAGGETVDLTRMAEYQVAGDAAVAQRSGLVYPRAEGSATLHVRFGGQAVSVPISVTGLQGEPRVDYVRDVMPVLSRLGCNAGTCHGSAQGKNGFKLSLRGYDPVFDVRALTDDLAARRVNIASPDDSLMLLKASGSVPHVGGQLTRPGEPYYEIMRSWIAQGAKLDLATSRVARIEIAPRNPIVERLGSRQQVRVLATYSNGQVRDVTREAFLESGNADVATAARGGLMTAVRRGEAPMLARFEGAYAATTLTVMGDRTGFVWQQPAIYNRIDELTAAKWQRMKILPSDVCNDYEFIRRVYLDLTGLPPSADDVRAFLGDRRDSRLKRVELVEQLVGNKEYIEYWTNKWADLLQVNRKFLGIEGAASFRKWIRAEVEKNTPYDQFVREILTAHGSNRENPPASYFKILRDPAPTMENTTHLFLGVRFSCNKCHDHPFERWTQDQYYQAAAFFAQVDLKADPTSGKQQLGATAVEKGKPLYEIVSDSSRGEVTHDRTGQVTPPRFPYSAKFEATPKATRREQLAAWITSKDNVYFARSYVNRIWGYLFGVGIIEPIDDIRAGNPPSNPELLDYLTQEFIQSGFNARHIIKLICTSRTYQLSVATSRWNADDHVNYSHAMARRLPAEGLYDAITRVTGSLSHFPGVPAGTRAAALPDSGIELPSGFLATFGRPPRESACECERSAGLQLGPVMALVNGPTIAEAIGDPNNEIAKLVARQQDDRKLIEEMFLRILNRPATAAEIEESLQTMHRITQDHQQLVSALKQREEIVAPIRVKQEKDRELAIVKAKADLAAYEKEIAPKSAELERQKAEKTAKLMAELKKYETTLPAKESAWEKQQSSAVTWIPLEAAKLTASGGTKLAKQPDLSILASGGNTKSIYTIEAKTELRGITGIRLEVLPDPSLPGMGPGRAPGGNFVLGEFELRAAAANKQVLKSQIALQNPRADFSQDKRPIKEVLDGTLTQGNGWAIGGGAGVVHWATFEIKEPLGYDGGTMLTFSLHQQFDLNEYLLGRFRISVTTAKKPLGLSLPEELKAILTVPAEKRDAKQQAALAKYYRAIDPGLRQRTREIAESKKPLPLDPKLKELRDTLAYVSRPVPVDAKLAQLRKDVEMSTQQMANPRLTGAQDITWALINSPAFLFNR